MKYTYLTPDDFLGLRRERITALEGEHFRLALLLDELVDPRESERLLAQQDEIERRITLHVEKTAPSEAQPA